VRGLRGMHVIQRAQCTCGTEIRIQCMLQRSFSRYEIRMLLTKAVEYCSRTYHARAKNV